MKKFKLPPVNKDEYFNKLAIEADITDTVMVKNIFYSMVRMGIRELKEKGYHRIPDLVDIRVHETNKNYHNIRNGVVAPLRSREVRSVIDYKIKEYIKKCLLK